MKIKFLLVALLTQIIAFQSSSAADFKLTSQDIKSGTKIANKHVFNGFGCSGDNISPQLFWTNPPKETKSFAITVYDPDAPTGSGWWHYLAVNILAKQTKFSPGFADENKFINSANITQIRNDFGIHNFGGPCPPKGDKPHRYIFTIHALKVEKLDLKEDATAALAGFMINANAIAKASFIATYSR